ncbi:eCIS core domain-containing protein [Natrinema salifodinae]|nr:DUF4157 domain-containing protein [Natrinema salifodinae]
MAACDIGGTAPAPTPSEYNVQRALNGTDTTKDEVPDTVLEVLGQGGKPLETPIQRALEEGLDADFSNVRIHTGATAAEAADTIDAKAFTCGNDIVFNAGEYDPESPEGQFLLAHELAHVRQQTGAAISMMPKSNADLEIDPDPQLEREADQAAAQAVSSEDPLTVNRLGTDVHIQRMPTEAQLDQARAEVEERFGTSVSANPESLAKEVERLRANQEEMMEVLVEAKPGAATDGPDVLEAASKGLAGGVTGAVVGSLLGPGGTATGFAAGLASSVATDVSKEGTEWLLDNSPGSSALELEARIESLEKRLAELRNEQPWHDTSGLVEF